MINHIQINIRKNILFYDYMTVIPDLEAAMPSDTQDELLLFIF